MASSHEEPKIAEERRNERMDGEGVVIVVVVAVVVKVVTVVVTFVVVIGISITNNFR